MTSENTLKAGPLAAEMVPLLTDRSVLRVVLPPVASSHEWTEKNEPPLGSLVVCAGAIPHQVCVFLADYEPGFGWHRSRFSYIGERDADGWIHAPAGGWAENPVPGMRVNIDEDGNSPYDLASESIANWWAVNSFRPAQTVESAGEGERYLGRQCRPPC